MKEKGGVLKIAVYLLCVAVMLAGAFVFRERVINSAVMVAVYSAKTFIPQAESGSVTTSKSAVSKQETTEAEKAESKQEQTSEQTTDSDSVQTFSSITSVDRDIKKLMKQEQSEKAEKGGDIQEKTYVNDGVTDKFGLVKMKNTNKTKVSIEKILAEKPGISVSKNQPAVLIFHTHTTETYQIAERPYYAKDFAPRSESADVNMIRVGKAVCEQLESKGIGVIHDTSIYDGTYSGAYGRSRKGAEEYLKKYPSISVVIDLHRDAIQLKDGTKIKPVADIKGKKAAQIMIISGCQEQGNGITNLPDWRKNLTFAVHLQNELEKNFPGITRPIFFCARSYNMNLSDNSLLIEMGSDANTLDEAVYAGKCLGVALAQLIKN